MYDIVGKRNLWFAISALLTIPGLIFIVLGGLRPSIDFTGGTEWEVRYADRPAAAEMRTVLAELGYPDALVTELPDGFLRIRTEPIDLIPAETPVSKAMSKELKRRGFRFVGPTVCYAFMQACGLVNDHTVDCFRYREVTK